MATYGISYQNGGTSEIMRINSCPLLFSFRDSDSPSDDNSETDSRTPEYSDISSDTTCISNAHVEVANPNGTYDEEYSITSTSVYDDPCLIFTNNCPPCLPGSEQYNAGQIENLLLGPRLGINALAEFSPQISETCCVSANVANGYNLCITEDDAERDVRVGRGGYATRWKKGSVLRYTVCTETFPSPQWAARTAREAAKAALMWQNIGARFEKVSRDEKATFAIKYCFEPDDCRPDVYARAFFPKTSPDELFVYQFALEPYNVDFLANILAHEFGHILGLRHEFAVETSFLLGDKNNRSIMNYFRHPSELQVGEQDREDLARYYECDGRHFKGLSIRDIKPQLYRFPRSNRRNVSSGRLTSKRLYLNYQTRRARRRRSLSKRRNN
ncbi:hypothetical protein TGAM01_v200489 [Trichoderma gamsii]|uniref:Peptidase metallopeptidase domain-containing protein n=1 Tax=Trichoderma gamsii TaxID=398673 RepID=A0A2P5A3I9_9HYPO|nr:hypothetical protein TGAM01_v200489 [Trichoderma gamsii]PON31069.1 hypothetical protein TGAM01_v200489 [Trichoderma gamsii]